MNETIKLGISFFLLGITFIYFSLKEIKKFKKEKYDPFRDKSAGIKRLLNTEVYWKSFGVFFFGVLAIVISVIYMASWLASI